MADYVITGRKGNGKGLYAMLLIKEALQQGKRVATNMDVKIEEILTSKSKATIHRLPDRPTEADLIAIGRGQSGVVEEDNGLLVLDECSHFLSSRDWSDKSRQGILNWLTMSRKHGWDTYLTAQGVEQLDKQVRTCLVEYRVDLKRTDKWSIPIITQISALFMGHDKALRFPKMHIAITKQGMDRNAFQVATRFFRGTDLWSAYNTQQVFLDQSHPEACGPHSMLSAWHLVGRYEKTPPRFTMRDWALFLPRLLVVLSFKVCRADLGALRTGAVRPSVTA